MMNNGIEGKWVGMMKYSKCICLIMAVMVSAVFAACDKPVRITEDNVTEESIVVEGLEQEYELLFLTDNHMVVQTLEDYEPVAENAAVRAPMFLDEEGVASAEQFPAWMKYATKHGVDAVLLGGDIIDYPSDGNLEYLQENLDTLTMPYLYTLGNHDWTYPWDYMTEIGKAEYLPLFEPMMEGNTVIHRLDIGELTVVAVDNSSGQVNGEALQLYQAILAEGRPTIVLVHVPFLTPSVLPKAQEVWSSGVVIGGGELGQIYPNEASDAFVEMTTAQDSPVIAVLAGHVHFYDKDYIDGEKPVLQLVGDGGFKRQGMMLHISGQTSDGTVNGTK